MFRVKICGITRLEDARFAVESGAWALGFIFYPASPRYVEPERVREILKQLEVLNLKVERAIGVFVNSTATEIFDVVRRSGVDTVQLHGDETPNFLDQLTNMKVFKAFRFEHEDQLPIILDYEAHAEAFLFDASVAGSYGGTGKLADWGLLAKIKSSKPLIVSGGLHPHNVRAAWEQLQPFALDLSSGVESSPGIKDQNKIRILFHNLGVS